MNTRKIPDLKAIAGGMFVQQARANAEFSISPPRVDSISSAPKSKQEYTLESNAEDGFYEPRDTSLLSVTRVDAGNLPSLAAVGGHSKTTDAKNRVQGKG